MALGGGGGGGWIGLASWCWRRGKMDFDCAACSTTPQPPSVAGRFKVALHSLRQEEEEEEGKGGCGGDEAGVGNRLKPSPKEYGFI